MPWQQLVNAVAGEVNPDGTFRYPTVVLSTPRQSGKTTLLTSILAHRCMTMSDFRSFYSSQSGQDARDTWREWERTLSTRMPHRWKFRQSNGEETATWPATGSTIRTFPPKPDALHGKQSDFVALDEVWNYTMTDGQAITQAVVPTQATRPRRQLWIVSTAGDEASLWMRGWIDRARASLEDPDSPIAYFEWSCPDDMDPTDPGSWPLFHPAYGRTIDDRAMHDALTQMGDQFPRAYGNRWPAVEASWRAGWPQLATVDTIPPTARVYLAADAQLNHRSAAITAAGRLVDGRIGVEVIDHRNGVDWLRARLTELSRTHRAPIAIQANGPLGYLLDELQAAGVRTLPVMGTDYANAAARLRTMIVGGGVAHRDDPRLNRAVDTVDTQVSGDRAVWRRRDVTVDISPLIAASLSIWQASAPPAAPKARGL
jgi:phage terminase large subunit-like protein